MSTIINESAPMPRNIKMGLAVVGCLFVIYIIVKYNKFTNSPVGKALGAILTGAEKILTALASLPPWALIGILATGLFGTAIMKMRSSNITDMAKAANDVNDKLIDITDIDSKTAIAEASATRLHETASINDANESQTQEAKARADTATTIHVEKMTTLEVKGFGTEAEIGEGLADEALLIK